MIKAYSYQKDKDRTLSKHFKVKEFASIAGKTLTCDNILINDDLISKLEKLIEELGATKAIVTSGYRDSKCDKLVGGSGNGQHCNGNASDIQFYIGDKIIDTKLVCCKAQDIGFTGIARISNTATHLDVRPEGKYFGDEMMGHTNSVTKDFYKYFNIKKENNRDKVKEKFGFAEETMKFLDTYKYSEDLYKKMLK